MLEHEPPRQDNPLLQMTERHPERRTTPRPPRASTRRRKTHVGRELALLLTGRWPMSCVNPAVLVKSNLRRWQPFSMERGPNS